MARPTKYNEEILKSARDYLENYDSLGDVIPQIAGLAIACGITRETVYAWGRDEEKEEFSDIVKELMASQEQTLVNKGLSGVFNSSITKLALTKHNYSDRIESTNTNVEMTHEEWLESLNE